MSAFPPSGAPYMPLPASPVLPKPAASVSRRLSSTAAHSVRPPGFGILPPVKRMAHLGLLLTLCPLCPQHHAEHLHAEPENAAHARRAHSTPEQNHLRIVGRHVRRHQGVNVDE